jgi:hypothetical protein
MVATMTNQAILDLENFPAGPHDDKYWLHHDGRTYFLWPALNRKTGQVVQVQVEVTSIRPEAVAEQLPPTRKAIELAARELYNDGNSTVRLMRPDAYWMQRP